MIRFLLTLVLAGSAAPAMAWGYEGHGVVALIARSQLTPAVRAKVDAILATDPDTLTRPTWPPARHGPTPGGHTGTA